MLHRFPTMRAYMGPQWLGLFAYWATLESEGKDKLEVAVAADMLAANWATQ